MQEEEEEEEEVEEDNSADSSISSSRAKKRRKHDEHRKKGHMSFRQWCQQQQLKRQSTQPSAPPPTPPPSNQEQKKKHTMKEKRPANFIKLTGRHLRHADHTTRNQKRLEHWKPQSLQELENGIPTSKTADLTLYKVHLRSFAKALPALAAFYGQRKVVRQKFDHFVLRKKFVDRWMNGHIGPPMKEQMRLHRKALETDPSLPPPRPIVIALGDASFHHAGRFQPPTPNKRIGRMLEERYCVMRVDEHNTSKLCCHCHKELHDIKAVRMCRDGQRREVTLRGIRLCKTGTNLITLDRDYSAAMNIMAISTHSITHGGERLTAFTRKDGDGDGDKDDSISGDPKAISSEADPNSPSSSADRS